MFTGSSSKFKFFFRVTNFHFAVGGPVLTLIAAAKVLAVELSIGIICNPYFSLLLEFVQPLGNVAGGVFKILSEGPHSANDIFPR